MKTQHVTWVCVIGASVVTGILLGGLVTRPSRPDVRPAVAEVVDPPNPEPPLLLPESAGDIRVAELISEADEGPEAEWQPKPEVPPAVLPEADDATPIGPIGPERERFMRRLIASRLPDATEQERDVWYEELKGLSPQMLEEVLEIRSALGSLVPRPPIQFETSPDHTPLVVDDPPTLIWPNPEPGEPVADDSSPGPSPEQRMLARVSLDAIRAAERVHLDNIANASTAGFRARRPVLATLPSTELSAQPGRGPAAFLGNGAMLVATVLDQRPGTMQATGRELDIAIDGAGWFRVSDGDRIAHTRDGSLVVDGDGRLCTATGFPLEPVITIPADALEIGIGGDGEVGILTGESEEPTIIGRIETARFANVDGLQPIGNNLFAATEASGLARLASPATNGHGTIVQGHVERSNVDVDGEEAELARLRRQSAALVRITGDEPHQVGDGVPELAVPEIEDAATSALPVLEPSVDVAMDALVETLEEALDSTSVAPVESESVESEAVEPEAAE